MQILRVAKLFMALIALIGAPLSANPAVQPVVEPGETLVLIEAVGIARAVPDSMTIRVGVVTTGESAGDALNANNKRMTEVLNALSEAGIEAKRITTSQLDVEPQFEGDRNSRELRRIVGYRVENEATVKFTDIDRAGEIISSLFDAGANRVSSPQFGFDPDKEERIIAQAEQDALSNARKQVQNLADTLNMKVSRVLRLSNIEIDFQRSYTRRGRSIVVTGSRIMATPIAIGELPVSAELYVEYALVPR